MGGPLALVFRGSSLWINDFPSPHREPNAQSPLRLAPERTLIDIARLRHREGPDVAWEALRRRLAGKESKPAALLNHG